MSGDGHVRVDGDAGPALLLTAGMAGAHYDWEPIAGRLAVDHRVLRLDRPGLGSSAARDHLPTLCEEVAHLAAAADRWAPHGAVVVAHSVSALHAEALGRLHPDTLRGVVLLDPSCEPPRPVRPDWLLRYSEAVLRTLVGGVERVGLTTMLGPALWSAGAQMQTNGPIPRDVEHAGRATFRNGAAVVAACQELLAFRGMITDLHTLRAQTTFPAVPVRILSATAGMTSSAATRWLRCHDRLADTLNAGHHVLPEARHQLVWESPDAVVDAIAAVTGKKP